MARFPGGALSRYDSVVCWNNVTQTHGGDSILGMNAANHGKATNWNGVSVHVCVLAQSDTFFFVYVTGYVFGSSMCTCLYVYITLVRPR